MPIVPAATVSEAPGPVAIAGGDEGFLLPRGNAVLVPERAERVPGAFQDDDNGPGVSQDLGSRMVVKPSVLRVSEIEFSTLVVSTMDLSVMAGPAPTYYTPMSTAAITPPGSANYHSFGGGAGSFDPPDPDREEEGRVTKVYYIKPIGGVIGTALLFLVIGLVFLRSHREGDAY